MSVLRLTQISQIPQVLLLRVLNLTEAGGYWSAPSAPSAPINKVPTYSPRGEFVGILNLWKFVIICGRLKKTRIPRISRINFGNDIQVVPVII